MAPTASARAKKMDLHDYETFYFFENAIITETDTQITQSRRQIELAQEWNRKSPAERAAYAAAIRRIEPQNRRDRNTRELEMCLEKLNDTLPRASAAAVAVCSPATAKVRTLQGRLQGVGKRYERMQTHWRKLRTLQQLQDANGEMAANERARVWAAKQAGLVDGGIREIMLGLARCGNVLGLPGTGIPRGRGVSVPSVEVRMADVPQVQAPATAEPVDGNREEEIEDEEQFLAPTSPDGTFYAAAAGGAQPALPQPSPLRSNSLVRRAIYDLIDQEAANAGGRVPGPVGNGRGAQGFQIRGAADRAVPRGDFTGAGGIGKMVGDKPAPNGVPRGGGRRAGRARRRPVAREGGIPCEGLREEVARIREEEEFPEGRPRRLSEELRERERAERDEREFASFERRDNAAAALRAAARAARMAQGPAGVRGDGAATGAGMGLGLGRGDAGLRLAGDGGGGGGGGGGYDNNGGNGGDGDRRRREGDRRGRGRGRDDADDRDEDDDDGEPSDDDDPSVDSGNENYDLHLEWFRYIDKLQRNGVPRPIIGAFDVLRERIFRLPNPWSKGLRPPTYPPAVGRLIRADLTLKRQHLRRLEYRQLTRPQWDAYGRQIEAALENDPNLGEAEPAILRHSQAVAQMARDQTPPPPPAAPAFPNPRDPQQIALQLGFEGENIGSEKAWNFTAYLGRGSWGVVSLFTCLDQQGRIIERCALKDTCLSNRQWQDPTNWCGDDGDVPKEYYMQDAVFNNAAKADPTAIVGIMGYGVHPMRNLIRLYMEHCTHGDLRSVLDTYLELEDQVSGDGALLPLEVRKIPEALIWRQLESMATAACAMAYGWPHAFFGNCYAWQPFILHRDIKPENIFLDSPARDGSWPDLPQVKLGDFGLAAYTAEEAVDNPRNHCGVGTSGFRPPEQEPRGQNPDPAVARKKVTPQADVWAIGRVTKSMMELDVDPRPVRWGRRIRGIRQDYYNSYSNHLKALVETCLVWDPAQRMEPRALYNAVRARTRVLTANGDGRTYSDGTYPRVPRLRLSPDRYKDLMA